MVIDGVTKGFVGKRKFVAPNKRYFPGKFVVKYEVFPSGMLQQQVRISTVAFYCLSFFHDWLRRVWKTKSKAKNYEVKMFSCVISFILTKPQ